MPDPVSGELYDERISALIDAALARQAAELERLAPLMARTVAGWLAGLSATGRPADYLKHPRAFPTLLLPWWLEGALAPDDDESFQAELVYSTVNGYCFIRLVDDLMDGEAGTELSALPAATFFHAQFQDVYASCFPPGHAFWRFFHRRWVRGAEIAMRDAALVEVDRAAFFAVAAEKLCAGMIPVAAVCHRHGRPDLIAPWDAVCRRLAAHVQMFDDLFDWRRDLDGGRATYFLSEGRRRKAGGESLHAWVAREGFDWGVEVLEQMMVGLARESRTLNNPRLDRYVTLRAAWCHERTRPVSEGFRALTRLGRVIAVEV